MKNTYESALILRSDGNTNKFASSKRRQGDTEETSDEGNELSKMHLSIMLFESPNARLSGAPGRRSMELA